MFSLIIGVSDLLFDNKEEKLTYSLSKKNNNVICKISEYKKLTRVKHSYNCNRYYDDSHFKYINNEKCLRCMKNKDQ
jgi:hypothetical protein